GQSLRAHEGALLPDCERESRRFLKRALRAPHERRAASTAPPESRIPLSLPPAPHSAACRRQRRSGASGVNATEPVNCRDAAYRKHVGRGPHVDLVLLCELE